VHSHAQIEPHWAVAKAEANLVPGILESWGIVVIAAIVFGLLAVGVPIAIMRALEYIETLAAWLREQVHRENGTRRWTRQPTDDQPSAAQEQHVVRRSA
jgi:hypothetical protein